MADEGAAAAGELAHIAAITDPFEAVAAATQRIAAARQEVADLARLRKQRIGQLRDRGVTFDEIADRTGLTRARVHQIHTGKVR